MASFDSYIICTSPRSGSTLLCKLLSDSKVAGHPASYFHATTLEEWQAYFGLPEDYSSDRTAVRAVFRAAMVKGTAETGIFGMRLQRHSFDFFIKQLALLNPDPRSDTARLEAEFGRVLFIHLTRQDKVEQAVSYVKAQQSGLWHAAPDGRELERLSAPQSPVYDPQAIRTQFQTMNNYERQWQAWFKAEKITPLQLTYADLSLAPQAVLCAVLDKLGLDPQAATNVLPAVAKLSDRTNHDWAKRFRAETGLT